jgi:hypothetical protein
MNGSQDRSVLASTLAGMAAKFFSLPFASTNPQDISLVADHFLQAAKSDFDSVSLIVDIVFLWWAAQPLVNDDREILEVAFNFLVQFLLIVERNQRLLSEFEITIVLPIVLECVGRSYELCLEIQRKLRGLCPPPIFLRVLVHVFTLVTSVYALQADLNLLLEILPTTKWDDVRADVIKTSTNLHNVLSKDPATNRELFQTSERLISFLKSSGAIQSNRHRSHCVLNPKIAMKMKSPSMLLYKWIVSLSSDDPATLISSLKEISRQLKADAKIFEPHLESVTVSLISLIHTFFAVEELDIRLCKYIAFCLHTVFESMPLKDHLAPPLVQQLLYELVTHLSNGVNEPVLHQVLNNLIVKLIEDCTVSAFSGLIGLISEYENRDQFTEKWVKLSLKCFDACGARLCTAANEEDIKAVLFGLERFFQKFAYEYLQASQFGIRIIGVFKAFVGLLSGKFPDLVNSRDVRKKLVATAALFEQPEKKKTPSP